jgi:membrane-associated protease RseP (regulator of RpoE activity)
MSSSTRLLPATAILVAFALAGALDAGISFAASPPPEPSRSGAERSDTRIASDDAAFERKLAAARERLEAAAREVAELSAGLAQDAFYFTDQHLHPGRVMLGVQLGEKRQGGGVRVASVSPGGPAAEAGVKERDVIVSVNGQKVASARDVTTQVRELAPGAEARLELDRSGKLEKVVVRVRPFDPHMMMVTEMPGIALDAMGGMFEHMPSWHGGGWGDLELAALSPELGHYFGTEKGVLIIKAPADGSLKLHDGDVITSIDGREPQNASHALRILRSYQPGEHVNLALLRDHKPLRLELSMPAHAAGGPYGPVTVMPPLPPLPPVPPAPPASPRAAAPAAATGGAPHPAGDTI